MCDDGKGFVDIFLRDIKYSLLEPDPAMQYSNTLLSRIPIELRSCSCRSEAVSQGRLRMSATICPVSMAFGSVLVMIRCILCFRRCSASFVHL
jgi:hypothetical protein